MRWESRANDERKEVSRARLPREASPAKVAKDGQDNNDDDDDPKPGRHAILSLGECRLYDEPTGIRNVYGPTPRWERLALGSIRLQIRQIYARTEFLHPTGSVPLLASPNPTSNA